MQTLDGKLYIISGKSRSGKTAVTAREVKKLKRIAAYDPEDQWSQLPGWKRVTTQAELVKAMQTTGPAKIAFVPRGDLVKQFDFFCGIVFWWGRHMGPCAAILEELADVTSPSKAPGNYGILLRRGLKRGITLYCISQRWAEADKTAFGNASEFLMFSMSSMDDMRYLARKTPVPLADLVALKAEYWDADCTRLKVGPYIRYNDNSGKIEQGKITFPRPH